MSKNAFHKKNLNIFSIFTSKLYHR